MAQSISFFSSSGSSITFTSRSLSDYPFSSQLHVDFSSFLGGNDTDEGDSIAVDSFGNAFVSGTTFSHNFPTKNALQPSYGGGFSDVFIAKFNSTGGLIFSTYFGGNASDEARGIAVDKFGNCYVTGSTYSSNFPTKNAFNSTKGDSSDVFLAKFDPVGSLIFSTYIGGSGKDVSTAIAVDNFGNSFITGFTTIYANVNDFSTETPFNTTNSFGFGNVFLVKCNSTGSLLFSTIFGGHGEDEGYGIAIDSLDNVENEITETM